MPNSDEHATHTDLHILENLLKTQIDALMNAFKTTTATSQKQLGQILD